MAGLAMAVVPLCLNPFLDVLRTGWHEERWSKFDVMVDVVVWGVGWLVGCLLVPEIAS